MKATKKIIDKLFSNAEWQSFKPKNDLPDETSEKMYAFILSSIDYVRAKDAHRKSLVLKLRYAGKFLAAASLITVLSFGLWFLISYDTRNPVNNAIVATVKRLPVSKWEEIRNTGVNTRKVQLPDSSVVKLYPNTAIKFAKIFKKDSRNVYLRGKAFFAVKKDPRRPFSVYAGGLKTTALGTAFTINTAESGKRTSVKLHHGKIVVHNTTLPSKPAVYISKAGSGLIYDPGMKTVALIRDVAPLKAVAETSIIREGSTITFKNVPLARVIQLLRENYQVTITAETSAIGNTTYTGSVDPQKESAEEVLKVICMINNLKLYNNGAQEFIIKKHN